MKPQVLTLSRCSRSVRAFSDSAQDLRMCFFLSGHSLSRFVTVCHTTMASFPTKCNFQLSHFDNACTICIYLWSPEVTSLFHGSSGSKNLGRQQHRGTWNSDPSPWLIHVYSKPQLMGHRVAHSIVSAAPSKSWYIGQWHYGIYSIYPLVN